MRKRRDEIRDEERAAQAEAEALEEIAETTEEEAEAGVETDAEASEEGDAAVDEAIAERDEQIAKLRDSYMRLMAEYENFRKRSRTEREQLYEQSVSDVVALWLPVLDNLERARQACEQTENPEVARLVEGLALVERQVQDVLARLEVEEIEALGASFDPERHEAVLHVEDEAHGSNEVVEVLARGYQRGERVIRHATVKVAN